MSRHGTVSRYTEGCHCEDCVRVGQPASRERSRRSRVRRITGPYSCPFCVQTFPTERGRNVHVTVVHDGGVK